MKHFLLAIAVLQFVRLAAPSVHAQAPAAQAPPSSAIASIKVSGAQKFPPEQIIAASGLKTGDVVTAAQIQEAADRLSALGIFSSVNFHFTSKGTAINLEFQVQDAPAYPIVFDNFPWLKAEDIAAAIRSRVGLFTGEAPGDGSIIEMMSAVIEDLLAAQKVKGSVAHQLISAASGDGMVMQFRLEGVTLRVQSVEFGDAAASASESFAQTNAVSPSSPESEPPAGSESSAAWDNWQRIRDTVITERATEAIAESAAVMADAAISSPNDAPPASDAAPAPQTASSHDALSNIVDNVLAELKPRLLAEIAKQLAQDKK